MLDEKLARHKKRKKRILTGILAIVGILAIAVTVFFTAYVADCQITEVSMDRKKRLRTSFFPRLWTSAFSISFLES